LYLDRNFAQATVVLWIERQKFLQEISCVKSFIKKKSCLTALKTFKNLFSKQIDLAFVIQHAVQISIIGKR